MSMFPPARIGAQIAVAALSGWQAVAERDAIEKRYRFANFNAAFAFMARAAMFAEKLDHHPEWTNVYNRVDVLLTTHDAGGVTELDVRMAQFMDEAAQQLAPRRRRRREGPAPGGAGMGAGPRPAGRSVAHVIDAHGLLLLRAVHHAQHHDLGVKPSGSRLAERVVVAVHVQRRAFRRDGGDAAIGIAAVDGEGQRALNGAPGALRASPAPGSRAGRARA